MLIFLLIALPLAYAAVHPFTIFVFALLSTLTFYLTISHRSAKTAFDPKVIVNPFVVLGFVFILAALFQLVPFPLSFLRILSPASGQIFSNYSLRPPPLHALSLYPWATVFDLIKFLSYAMIFLTVVICLSAREGRESAPDTRRHTQDILRLGCLSGCLSILLHSLYDFNSHITANAVYFTVLLALACGPGSRGEEYNRRFFKRTSDAIIGIGLAIAVFAIVQKFSFNGRIFWIGIPAARPVGPYYNYDHFAGFMELCAPLAAASAVANISHSSFSRPKGWVKKILWFSTMEANQTLRYIFCAMLMAAAIFMSTSRGGIMSFCISQVIFFSVIMFKTRRRKKGQRFLFLLITLGILTSIFVLWLGHKEFLDRFKMTSLEKILKMEGQDARRLMFYRDTIAMTQNYPVLGTGLGTFGSAFPRYRTFDYTLDHLRYAHNDYLQLTAEMGFVVGGMIVAAFLILFLREYLSCLKRLE